MVVTGTRETVAASFTGPLTLIPSSFTELDDIADAFAHIDETVAPGSVRVKVWVEGATGLPVLTGGDSEFSFEREWVVAGTFTGTVEHDPDTDVLVVTRVLDQLAVAFTGRTACP